MSIGDHLLNVPIEAKFPGAKRVGSGYMMLCPFHEDKNPSLSVFPEGNYNCFACGEKGNYISYLMKTRVMSMREAYEEIERLTGVKLSAPENPEKERFHRINELAVQFYSQQLMGASHVKAYLTSRGISEESIAKFRLGYASGASLLKELRRQGYTEHEIRKAGLLKSSNKDFFQDRLMFPIINGNGKIYGFAGRTLDGNNGAKYINSPETAFFKKGSLLYGLDTQNARSQGHVIIAEGYFDVIALHQQGYCNAVALMGTAVSEKQIGLLKQAASKAIVACDGDVAGQKASVRLLKQLLHAGIESYVVELGDDDPASFIQKGGNFEDAINAKKSGAAYLMEKVADSKERREIIHTVAANYSVPDFLVSLNEKERYMFAEISARELLTSLRDKMKPLVRLKNTEIEVRQWDGMAIAFSEGKMVAVAKLAQNAPKESAVELARAVYRGNIRED